jgi:hypothetical protein
MSYFSKRALRWAAPVALVGAVGLAACGDNDDSEATRIAAPRGVNAWLSEQAIEREAQLDNRAAELARQAEQYERSAHLDGQAEIYGGTGVPTNSDANLPNAFEAGNRAVQMTQAPAYVAQQQDRAESNSLQGIDPDSVRASNANSSHDSGYDDDFLPGGHHVPSR